MRTVTKTELRLTTPPLYALPPRCFANYHSLSLNISQNAAHLVANMALREEKVAASSFRAFNSLRSFIMVSVTMDFSFSYLPFRLARATSAV